MNEKNSNEPNIGAVLNEKDKNKQKEMYNKYVDNMTPKSNGFMNCLKAYNDNTCRNKRNTYRI